MQLLKKRVMVTANDFLFTQGKRDYPENIFIMLIFFNKG